jgi:nucleotidyltransferase/DNA polymerase involved in DNA repair
MIAKICSDLNKPNGQAYVRPVLQEVLDFVGKMAIRKIPYIGGMKETTLHAMGFKTA